MMEPEQVVVVTTQLNEIPVARRLTPNRGEDRHHNHQRWLWLMVTGSLLPVFTMVVRPIGQHVSPSLASHAARIEHPEVTDGRLLGHFPYALASAENLVDIVPGIRLHRDVAADLLAMQQAAARDGVELRLLSGFRDHETQDHLFFNVMAQRQQLPEERALVSAPPGHSEHHSGYAIDIGDGPQPELDFTTAFENTPAFHWLQEHAASYHFRLSFPKGNEQGVSYEPWHWRWEGSIEALTVFHQAQHFHAHPEQKSLIISANTQNPSR